MEPRLLKLLHDVRSSYWFVPAIMAVLALILGGGVLYVDAVIGSDWLNGLSWYQANKADGAQEVLSTIAGSAITVAGVVFSITIVSVSFAASQYGPRVLSNFMSDRGNQVTLGTFIATFLYCIVVLRTIRGGDDAFVPDLAIIVALCLALCSISVLIFFIHHVPTSIHVNTVIAGIGRQLIHSLQTRFPQREDALPGGNNPIFKATVPTELHDLALLEGEDVAPVLSLVTGYIGTISDRRLIDIASPSNLIIRLRYQAGDYIHSGEIFADAWPIERVQTKCGMTCAQLSP